MNVTEENKAKEELATIQIAKPLHKLAKQKAAADEKSLREVIEAILGPAFGWEPKPQAAQAVTTH